MGSKPLILSSSLRGICVGLMLGDATMQTQSDSKTYRMKFQMLEDHRDYAEILYQYFGKEWIPSKPHSFQRTNESKPMLSFQTVSTPALVPIAKLFYQPISLGNNVLSKTKTIPPLLIENQLTEAGLACWFMDDGSKGDWTKNRGKQIHLHTHGFTEIEVKSLCEGLSVKWGLEAWPKKNRGRHIVCISGNSFKRFQSIVMSYLVPSFYYKMPR